MRKSLVILAAGLFAAAIMATPASAFLQNWSLDIDGSGAIAPTTINEYFDTVGPSYIVNTITDTTTGTFDDYGAFTSSTHDGGLGYTWAGSHELTGLFQANGTVDFSTGTIGFNGGTLNIYADDQLNFGSTGGTDIYGANDGVLIGTFDVQLGDGTIAPSGIPNGAISVQFQSSFLEPGYWFDENGNDLSTSNPNGLIFGIATTNASYVANPNAAVVGELANEFAGVTGDPANTPPGDLFVGTNGQFRTAPVPIPGTILLLGSGMLGLVVTSKRKFRWWAR